MDKQMDFDDMEEAAVPGESKAERFRRVVNPRLKAAVKRLRMIRQMVEGGNANNYEFTDEQRIKIIQGLRDEVENINKLMYERLNGDEEETLFI